MWAGQGPPQQRCRGRAAHAVNYSVADPPINGPDSLHPVMLPELLQLLRVGDGQVLHQEVATSSGSYLGNRGIRKMLLLEPHDRVPHITVAELHTADGGESPSFFVNEGLANKSPRLQNIQQQWHRINIPIGLGSVEDGLDDLVVGLLHVGLLMAALQLRVTDREANNTNAGATGVLVEVVESALDLGDLGSNAVDSPLDRGKLLNSRVDGGHLGRELGNSRNQLLDRGLQVSIRGLRLRLGPRHDSQKVKCSKNR